MVTSAPSVISTSEPSAITRPPVVSLMVSEPPAGLSVSSVSAPSVSVFSTPPLMVRFVFASLLVPEPSLAPPSPTRIPSTLTFFVRIPSFSFSIALEPSMAFSPFRVRSTLELSCTLIPAFPFCVRLTLVLSSVRSTLAPLFSSSPFRFTPISMPLPPVVRLESLTVRSTSAPSPTLMMVLSSLVFADTSAGVSVGVLVSLVSTFTPSTTMVASFTSSLTVMVFPGAVSVGVLFSVLSVEESVV